MANFSTYQQVTNDIHQDFADDEKMSQIGQTQLMTVIQRWEQNLSQRINLQGQLDINLISGQVDYQVDQLPERIEEFISVTRLVNGFLRKIEVVKMDRLLEAFRWDTERFIIWSDYDCPNMCAMWTKDKQRYIKVYPAPLNASVMTAYYRLNLLYRDLSLKGLTDDIAIPMEYEEILKFGAKYQIYSTLLKDVKKAGEMMDMYENLLAQHDRNIAETARQIVTYR